MLQIQMFQREATKHFLQVKGESSWLKERKKKSYAEVAKSYSKD